MFVISEKEEKVCRVNKPLYELKQAGRNWYQTLDKYITTIGLDRSQINPCVYVSSTNNSNLILLIYVHDILIAARDLEELVKANKLMRKKFKINDLRKVNNILGIHVERDGDTGSVKLNQRKYIEKTLEKFGMEHCKPACTPMVPGETFDQEIVNERKLTEIPSRELIGALIYISNATRPDIAFSANALSQFNGKATNYHWKAAKHVLHYLKGTINYGIKYSFTDEPVKIYVYSDWAADGNGRRSRSGYVSMLAGPKAKIGRTINYIWMVALSTTWNRCTWRCQKQ